MMLQYSRRSFLQVALGLDLGGLPQPVGNGDVVEQVDDHMRCQARLAAGTNPDIVIGNRTSVKRNSSSPALTGTATGQALEPAATRSCPRCGEAITIVALLTTPEAARPALPTGSDVIPIRRT